MKVDGNTTTPLGEVTLKNTGGWSNYQDSDTIEVKLDAGKQFIRIYFHHCHSKPHEWNTLFLGF